MIVVIESEDPQWHFKVVGTYQGAWLREDLNTSEELKIVTCGQKTNQGH